MTRPDFNFDPEIQVLNDLLWSRDESAVSFVLEALQEDDFFNPLYGQLFTAIKDSYTRGDGRDAVSVNTRLLNSPDEIGVAHPQQISHLLVNVAVLETPQHNLRGSAYAVLHDSYRRGFDAAAESLKFASENAPTDRLFDVLVEHGKQQRAATERIASFLPAFDAAAKGRPSGAQMAAEDMTPLERIEAQRNARGASRRPHEAPSVAENVAQGEGREL